MGNVKVMKKSTSQGILGFTIALSVTLIFITLYFDGVFGEIPVNTQQTIKPGLYRAEMIRMANVKDSILQWYLPLQIEKVTMSVNTERVVSIRYYGDGGLETAAGQIRLGYFHFTRDEPVWGTIVRDSVSISIIDNTVVIKDKNNKLFEGISSLIRNSRSEHPEIHYPVYTLKRMGK